MSTRRFSVCISLCATALVLGALGPGLAAGDSDWAGAPGEPDPAAASRQAFARYCTACHAGPASEPVNFLQPDVGSPAGAIAQCAERIAFRLALWDWPEALRPKTPMPPDEWLRSEGFDAVQWPASEARAVLLDYVAGLLVLTGSSAGRVEQIGGRAYDDLRPCLNDDRP